MHAIRPPEVAGTLYPENFTRLRAMVEGFLREKPRFDAASPPRAVIAPHAGYIYSGSVAAHSFRALGEGARQIRRIVLIGPAHFVPIRGIAAPRADAFRTPLGDVPVDQAALAEIAGLPQVEMNDQVHAREHALEVELPFLQVVLGEFVLVPLVVGDADPHEVAEVLGRLWGGEETVVVVSSDLSHYHNHATATRRDAATAAAIERLDGHALRPDDACGWLPIAGLLLEAKARAPAVERLDLRNSGDTAGPKDRVVGYGAWAFRDPA